MSIIACLISKAAEGKIDDTELQQIRKLYDKHFDELSEKVGSGELETTAAADTLRSAMKSLEGITPELKTKLNTLSAKRKAIEKTLAVVDARDGVKLRRAQSTSLAHQDFQAHLDTTLKSKNASTDWAVDSYWEGAMHRKEFLSGQLMNPARDLLHAISPSGIGRSTDAMKAASDLVLDGWFNPSKASPDARKLSDLLKQTLQAANNMMKEAGHPIPDPMDARLPILLDSDLMKKIGPEIFVQDMMRTIDIPYLQKQYPELMNRDMETVFNSLYKRMTGLTKAEAGTSYKNVRNFLSIQDQANFRDITSKYASDTLYDNIIRKIDDAASQTTLLEKAGASPKKLADSLLDNEKDVNNFMMNYEYQRGDYAIKNDPKGVLTGIRNTKSGVALTQLGGTMVQAFLTDPYTGAMAQYNAFGVNAALKSFVNQFISPLGYMHVTRDAERVAGMMELFTSITTADSRMMEGGMPSKVLQLASNAFYRYTGLTGITNAHKAMTILETGWHMADFINDSKALRDLPANLQKDLRSVGLTDESWKLLTKDFIIETQSTVKRSMDAFSPTEMFLKGNAEQRRVATQLGEFFHIMKERATPTSSAVMKARMAQFGHNGVVQAGTAELIGTYAGFVTSIYQNTVRRAMNDFSIARATGTVAALYAGMTVLDIAYRELMSLARGDGLKPVTLNYVGQSMLRSLPIPYVQNFLSSDGKAIFGPLGSLGTQLVKQVAIPAANLNAEELVKGTTELGLQYAPGSNIWYLSGLHKQIMTPLIKSAIYGATDSMLGTKLVTKEAKREARRAKKAAGLTHPRTKKEKF